MKTVTVADVMNWDPCPEYTPTVIKNLFGERKKLSALQILKLKIPAKDRIWAVLRNVFLDDKNLRLLAADYAEHVLHFFESKYPENKFPRLSIEAARKFACGEITTVKLAAAANAAYAAYAASAAYAAYAHAAASAAYDASAAAHAASAAYASATAAAATYAAANAAAAYAYDAASAEVERNWQIETLKKYLGG